MPERAGAVVLEVSQMSKTFGATRVLDRVDLAVRAGEIHCLLGHNGSGKSTLIKILAGVHDPDPGSRLTMNGEPVALPLRGQAAQRLGISFVHQSLGLAEDLTVAENLILARQAMVPPWYLRPSRVAAEARDMLAGLGVKVDPRRRVADLPQVEKALVAIVRAVDGLRHRPGGMTGAVLVLDEPTAFLPRDDVQHLFAVVREATAQGAAVIIVTHDTDEVLEIATCVTVLRDGRVVGTVQRAELTKPRLIHMIVGKELEGLPRGWSAPAGTPLATVHVKRAEGLRDFRLAIRPGEVVGLTGLIGSAYATVLYALFGATPAAGTLTIDGRAHDLTTLSPRRAMSLGMGLIPSDRPGLGAALDLTVMENAILVSANRLTNPFMMRGARMEAAVRPVLERYHVRPLLPQMPLGRLSGGNQQKVLLAKWVQTAPRLLLMDEPTQGIDIGARAEVFRIVRELAAAGTAILVASTDHDQLAAICDRVLIFGEGGCRAELGHDALTPTRITSVMLSATQASAATEHFALHPDAGTA